MADVHTPLRDIANTTPTREARARASSLKRTDNAEAASSPSGRSATPAATPQTDDVGGAKLAASVEIDALILAFERAVDEECTKIQNLANAQCEQVDAEFKAKLRSMPKKLKTAPVTEFADALASDGGQAALEELARVNKYLESIDASLVRSSIDEAGLRAAAKSLVEDVVNDAKSKATIPPPPSVEVDLREVCDGDTEAQGVVEKLQVQVSALVMRLLNK